MADPPPTCHSDPSHNRRLPKAYGNVRPLKTTLSHDSTNRRKLNTRVALLESQLGQAHNELKLLKVQLAMAEVSKKDDQKRTKKDAMTTLRAKLAAMEAEVDEAREHNRSLMADLAKTTDSRIELGKLVEALKASKATTAELNISLLAAKNERDALEAEIRTLRVQTEQWRKAADVAAAVLAADGCFPTADDSLTADETEDDAFRKHKGSGIRLSDLWKKKTVNNATVKQST